MKFLIAILALTVAAAEAGELYQEPARPVWTILRQAQDQTPDGSYQWSYETENGIAAAETGISRGVGPNGENLIDVEGFYRYVAPDGTPIETKYKSGPDGFVAEGAHLPVPSEAILRSIAYNAAYPQQEESTGVYKPQPQKPVYVSVTPTTPRPIYQPIPTITRRPVYDVELPTTPRPVYRPLPTYQPSYQPGYPQQPGYPAKYTQ